MLSVLFKTWLNVDCREIQTRLKGKNILNLLLKLINSRNIITFFDYTIEFCRVCPIMNAFLVIMFFYYTKNS